MKYLLFILLLLSQVLSSKLSAQTKTWTGSIDTAWTNPDNWSPSGVPGPNDNIIVNKVTNAPTLFATSLDVRKGKSLTVKYLAILNIDGNSVIGDGIHVSGMVINNGTINISNTTDDGIELDSNSIFINEGMIDINSTSWGIYSALSGGGTFQNSGNIRMSYFGAVTNSGVWFAANRFENQSCGMLLLIGSGNIVRDDVDSIINYGSILENATGTSDIQENHGIVYNINGGIFNIDSGSVALTILPLVSNWTGSNDNYWSAACNWDSGIVPGTLINHKIVIPTGSPFCSVIRNSVTINSGDTLEIQESGQLYVSNNLNKTTGIANYGAIINSGKLSVGQFSENGLICNGGILHNNYKGDISINGSTKNLSLINSGRVVNNGKLEFYYHSQGYSIYNSASSGGFHNLKCGYLRQSGNLTGIMDDAGNFLNEGFIKDYSTKADTIGINNGVIVYPEASNWLVSSESGILTSDQYINERVVLSTEADSLRSLKTIIECANYKGSPISITFHSTLDSMELSAANGQIEVKTDVTLNGNGKYKTIIDGDLNDSSRIFMVDTSVVFTCKNLTIKNGGGINFNADGGGIHSKGYVELINCMIFNCTSMENGGAIKLDSTGGLTAANCIFKENYAETDGGTIYTLADSAKCYQSLFVKNSSIGNGSGGAGVFGGNGPILMVNNTVSGNSGQMIGYSNERLELFNNIFISNQTTDGIKKGTATLIAQNNLIDNLSGSDIVYGINGNFEGDPMFTDTTNCDFTTTFGSAAIDRGDASYLPYNRWELNLFTDDYREKLSVDLRKRERISGGGLDVGAYEFCYTYSDSIIYVDHEASGLKNGTSWLNAFNSLELAIRNANCDSNITEIWIAKGTYRPSRRIATYSVGIPAVEYSTFFIQRSLKIYGGFKGDESSISERDISSNPTSLSGDLDSNDLASPAISFADVIGSNANRIIWFESYLNSSKLLLDGIIVSGAKNPVSGDQGRGGAIYVGNWTTPDSIVLTLECSNSRFTGNNAHDGSVIGSRYSASNPVHIYLKNCSFSGNSAWKGTICLTNYNSRKDASKAFVQNCIFSNNTTGIGGVFGLTFFGETRDFPILISNSIFSNNTTTVRGGVMAMTCLGDIKTQFLSCSFLNNTSPSGNLIYTSNFGNVSDSAHYDFINCIIWDTTLIPENSFVSDETNAFFNFRHCILRDTVCPPTTGSASFYCDPAVQFNTDPLFENNDLGDLRISACSPAHNAGSNTLLPADACDLDQDNNTSENIPIDIAGWSRVEGDSVDIGAYEVPGDGKLVTSTLDDGPGTFRRVICCATDGDTIHFDPSINGAGIMLTNPFSIIGRDLVIQGNGWDSTIIDGDSLDNERLFDVYGDAQLVLEDMAFVNGGGVTCAQAGGAINMNHSGTNLTINRCKFQNNQTNFWDGTAFSSFGGTSRFKDCIFMDNYRQTDTNSYQFYLLGSSNSYIDQCIFTQNDQIIARGLKFNPATTVWMNGNSSFGHRNINFIDAQGSLILNNNAFYNPQSGTEIINSGSIAGSGNMLSNYTSSGLTVGIDGNLVGNPLFTSEEHRNLALLPCSPAINAGINDSIPAGFDEDFNGLPRITNGQVDIGAIESQRDTSRKNVVFANANNGPQHSGSSWEDAMSELYIALEVHKSCPIDTIFLTEGTYTLPYDYDQDQTFLLHDSLTILGGYRADGLMRDPEYYPSILSGVIGPILSNNVWHVVRIPDSVQTLTIDGVELTGGLTIGHGASNVGPAIYCNGNVDLRSVKMYGNHSLEGAPMFISSNSRVRFIGCSIYDNTSDFGSVFEHELGADILIDKDTRIIYKGNK